MSILSDAWRRARGESDEVSRALGAPPVGPGERHGHLLPWMLCGVLLVMVVGLGVYLWRSRELAVRHSAKAAPLSVPTHTVSSGTTSKETVAHKTASAVVTPPSRTAKASMSTDGSQPPNAAAGAAVASGEQMNQPVPASGSVPDSVRAALPPLAVTVHVWNPRPRSRFIVVGGHLFREGESLSPGLRLVSITENGEVVKFRGYLITLGGGN